MSPVKAPQKLGVLDVGKKEKVVVEKDEVEEELIPGWTKEVKIRKTGSKTKVDRYYTDPVTGYIFHSFRDVQRYLKTGEVGRLASKPKIEETEKPIELKEQMTETFGNKRAPTDKSELPARASKRLAGIDSDTILPSLPVSPSQPKTRHATQLAGIKVDAPSMSQSLPEPKTRQATRLAGVVVDASLPTPSPRATRSNSQATKQTGNNTDASVPSPPPAVPKTRQAARQAGIIIDSPPPVPPVSKTHQATPPSKPDTRSNSQAAKQTSNDTDASVPSPRAAIPKTRQAASQAGIKIDSPPSMPPEPKTRQVKRASGVHDNASLPRPKTRKATQEAGIKIYSPPPDTRTSRQATQSRLVSSSTRKENDKKNEAEKTTDKHNENADMDANTNCNLETNKKQELRYMLPPVTSNEYNKKIETGPTTSHPVETQPPAIVVPPANIEKQGFPLVNPTISNPVPQASYSYGNDTKPDSSTNFSMKDLWTDPCIEFAVKTLTGAIPFTDLNTVENFNKPVEVPLEELWTDPCIEFAVKTLTGAIPVGEDDYLLHRPSSSANPQGPHNFSSPMSVCQTGHKNMQQDSVFPTLGNGGLQKSGKFVNGSNGQCSRPRFFQ